MSTPCRCSPGEADGKPLPCPTGVSVSACTTPGASPRPAYWHGGAPGLNPGQYVLPPSITGTQRTLTAYEGNASLRPNVRRDRVYVATTREVAEVFAAMYPCGGDVYLVLPEGELEVDPDCTEPGMSLACERARIIRAIDLSLDDVVSILESVGAGGEG